MRMARSMLVTAVFLAASAGLAEAQAPPPTRAPSLSPAVHAVQAPLAVTHVRTLAGVQLQVIVERRNIVPIAAMLAFAMPEATWRPTRLARTTSSQPVDRNTLTPLTLGMTTSRPLQHLRT